MKQNHAHRKNVYHLRSCPNLRLAVHLKYPPSPLALQRHFLRGNQKGPRQGRPCKTHASTCALQRYQQCFRIPTPQLRADSRQVSLLLKQRCLLWHLRKTTIHIVITSPPCANVHAKIINSLDKVSSSQFGSQKSAGGPSSCTSTRFGTEVQSSSESKQGLQSGSSMQDKGVPPAMGTASRIDDT